MFDLPNPEVYLHQKTEQVICYSNPLLLEGGFIPFSEIEGRHFVSATDTALESLKIQIKSLESISNPTWETIMDPLEGIEERMWRVFGPMSHLTHVNDSLDIRLAWAKVEPLWTRFSLELKQNPKLFQAFKKIKEEQWDQLTSNQQKILENRLKSAELFGVGLNIADQEKFNLLSCTLNKLQTTYQENINDSYNHFSLIIEDRSFVEGVPFQVLAITSERYNQTKSPEMKESTPENGPWNVSLSPPIYLPFMRYCKNREIREKLYFGSITKASTPPFDNTENVILQLKLRNEMSKLLGFESFAELSLSKKMAGDVHAVETLLEDLRSAAWEKSREEIENVISFAKSRGLDSPFMPWDLLFYMELIKKEEFEISEEILKNYFPFEKVLEGLFSLTSDLFGVTIESVSHPVSVWHPDVSYFVIKNEKKEQIASFYLDPYSRPLTKRPGAWMDTCANRFEKSHNIQLPIAYLNCNGSPPVGSSPALLNFREVETLFHEFGHGLQHMLTQIGYPSIAGINGIEWDVVELPSQFMENWCYHIPTLKKISSHFQTGEPLNDEQIEKIVKARHFFAATDLMSQIKYGLFDLQIHQYIDSDGSISPEEIWNQVAKKTSHLPLQKEDRFHCSFSHIFGSDEYASGYYSYIWAKVMSSDAFHAFEEAGLDDREAMRNVGKRFCQTFLSLGGSVDPLDVFILFRGRKPKIEPFLKANNLEPND